MMRAELVALTVVVVGTVTTAAEAGAATDSPAPSCGDEALIPRCAWDARHEGNGAGRSYVTDARGHVVPVPHWVAHELRNGGQS